MKTRMLLAAASTLAIAACGGAETETAEVEDYDRDDAQVAAAETEEDGALGTLLSPEQPPLEGDSPFVDEGDVAQSRLDQENLDSGFDGPDLTDGDDLDTELAEADAELDEFGNNIEREAEEFEAGAERLAANTEREFEAAGREIEAEANEFGADTRSTFAAAERDVEAMGDDVERETEQFASNATAAASTLAPTVTDGVSAKQYTAENTDAYIAQDGELITGSEAALLAGSWDVTLGDGADSLPLMIRGEGDMATGTFDGEPIEVAVTGRNFQFDAPVDMDGETSIMTFTGTFEDGEIDNGVVEAMGDGSTMTFTAERTGEATEMDIDTDRDASRDMNMDMDAEANIDMDRDAATPLVGTTTRDTTITPRTNYDDDEAMADRLTREQNMSDDMDDMDDAARPSGVDRPLTPDSEPLNSRGDFYDGGDTGVTEAGPEDDRDRLIGNERELDQTNEFGETELDDMNAEVDGRDDAVEPLDMDDDAVDEAMDDDPNFEF